MAKAVGLDPGEFEVKVVELDGSYRKPKLTKVSIDRVEQSAASAADELHAQREAESALHALKDASVGRDNVTLGFPCREAVLRILTVPFVGEDQIRKVIKFEAEGEIHSYNVDDMVVDFHTIEQGDGETKVLVAAVPKRSLSVTLAALERYGIEPEVVDLDTMALYRVAEWAGCFSDDGEDADAGALALIDERVRLIVDVGARSMRVLAVRGTQLIDMRALRLGVDSIAEDLVQATGADLAVARDAVVATLDSGVDFVLETEDPADDDYDDDGDYESGEDPEADTETAPVVQAESITHAQVTMARDRFLMRVRRQLLQFLTGLPQVKRIHAVWLTGGGSRLEGLDDVLRDVFGCEARELDVLGKLSHNLDDEEAEHIGPRIATAVGLALGVLGGPAGFDFRQEELMFTRRFDRIKFPLAIACMLGVFLPFIYGMKTYLQLEYLERQYGQLYSKVEKEGSGRLGRKLEAEFWGYVGHLMNPKNSASPAHCEQYMDPKAFRSLVQATLNVPTFERLRVIKAHLGNYLTQQQEDTGIFEDLQVDSGFYVLAQFSELIDRLEDPLRPFLIIDVDLNLGANERLRSFEFEIAFFGDDFAERLELLKAALRESFGDPDSPWLDFSGPERSETFSDGADSGCIYTIKLKLKGAFA